jgi:hypothetical protein
LISPASQIGRHRAMAGLSTMTHATTHATHILTRPKPPFRRKSVTEKWGKYDVLISVRAKMPRYRRAGAGLPIRESRSW